MMALISKELRQLLPIAFLWLALLALSIGFELFSSRIDEQSYERFCDVLCSPGIEYSQATFLLILCLVTAYSLYPREVDERTIDFLYALPIKKSTIFYGKFIAVFFMVCALLAFSYLVLSFMLSFNPESMSGQRYHAIDMSLYLRDCIFAFVILAHGVFLSRFRVAGLIVYALYLLLVRWLETNFDDVAWFSVYEIFHIAYDGDKFSYNTNAMIIHVIVALVLLMLACSMWSKAQGKTVGDNKPKKSHQVFKVIASVLAFLLMASALVGQVLQNSKLREEKATEVLRTDHYRFVFLSTDKSRAEELHAVAEDQYQQLRAILNAESEPVIQVDMTSESEHAAGLAQWKTIKMGISNGESAQRYERVLSHETAHVFQSVESNRGFRQYFNATRFYIEGMANYVSFEIVPRPVTREENRNISAVSWKRQTIRFEDMVNSAAFAKKYNAELVYGLGEIWTEALVDVCGEEAPGDILRAAGRDGAPLDLSALGFWRTTLQTLDCELELVNGAWRDKLNARYDNLDQELFPVIDNIAATQEGSDVSVTATVSVDADITASRYIIRIRKPASSVRSVDPVFYGDSLSKTDNTQEVTFNVPSTLLKDGRFKYQIGYQYAPGSPTVLIKLVNVKPSIA